MRAHNYLFQERADEGGLASPALPRNEDVKVNLILTSSILVS